MAPDPIILPSTGRRRFLQLAAMTGGSLMLPMSLTKAFAANPVETKLYGLSAFGELRYPPDFKHFDYVRPGAPKGGQFNFSPPNWLFNENPQTFNTLNCFVLKGDAPPRMEMCFDTLLVSALDEPDSLYCHLAEWVTISADRNTYTFGLREGARFHDGTPITAADVTFSFLTLKENGHPQLAFPLVELLNAVALDSRTVQIRYSGNQSAHAVLSIGSLPVLSRAYYTQHPFESSTLDVPLSSGQYGVGKFEAGRYIEYRRVPDYWGRNLPTAIGLNNFDVIRIDFFTEREAAFEAFKKGAVHWHEEFVSKTWATEYHFPAVTEGKVVKAEFPEEKLPTMQAWAVNQRRARFADPRVRQAIDLCFDFEWTNAKIFYNAYSRSQS
ncbi:MAG TPA: extracellular solute-binding protein, partial [Pararhizobium sp.]|nr:extracellular solute-binding protein [Pararhizobium sp.]